MENANEDPNLYKRINNDLFKKSAILKKKNNIVLEKLRRLKKLSDELLKSRSPSKR